jgi:hypothetical protein
LLPCAWKGCESWPGSGTMLVVAALVVGLVWLTYRLADRR